MILFAIISMAIVLLTMQHLLNYGWRKADKPDKYGNVNESAIVVMVLISIVFASLTIYGMTWLAHWIVLY